MNFSFFFESKFREFDDTKFLKFQTTDGTEFSMSETWKMANRKKKLTPLQQILFRKDNNYDRLYRISVEVSVFDHPEATKFKVSRRTNPVSTSIIILLKKYRKLKFRNEEATFRNVYGVEVNESFFTDVFKYRISIIREFGPPKREFSHSGIDSILALSDDLSSLMETNPFYDVLLSDGSTVIPAHRNILQSRSEYFDRIFARDATDWRENQGIVYVKGTSMATMKELIHYLYSGTIKLLDFDSLYDLYIAADKYLIVGLKQMLSIEITKFINPQNVVAVLMLAHVYNESEMKTSCLDTIAKNSNEVSLTECWRSLENEDELSELMLEVNRAINNVFERERNEN